MYDVKIDITPKQLKKLISVMKKTEDKKSYLKKLFVDARRGTAMFTDGFVVVTFPAAVKAKDKAKPLGVFSISIEDLENIEFLEKENIKNDSGIVFEIEFDEESTKDDKEQVIVLFENYTCGGLVEEPTIPDDMYSRIRVLQLHSKTFTFDFSLIKKITDIYDHKQVTLRFMSNRSAIAVHKLDEGINALIMPLEIGEPYSINDVPTVETKCIIEWTMQDVMERAAEKNLYPTHEQAVDILSDMYQNHDANNGITWDTIDYCLNKMGDDVAKGKEKE